MLSERLKSINSGENSEETAVAFVCHKNSCSLPVSTPEELEKILLNGENVAET